MKVKNKRIDQVFLLIFGTFFLVLGLISWHGFYAMGLVYILWSLSYTKYRAYGKYIVSTLLICAVAIATLGFLGFLGYRFFIYATSLGMIGGGVAFFVSLKMRERK